MASKKFVLEICVDSIESAINAINGGANRLEVCSSLKDDGCTPSNGLCISIKNYLKANQLEDKTKIYAMIRCRGGDFVYSKAEIETMIIEINQLKGLGVSGFVFGCLNSDGSLDIDSCKILLNECQDFENTFHRALDKSNDPLKVFEQVIELGFSRIITSGKGRNAFDGLELIKKLIEINRDRIKLSPASGIDDENLEKLIKELDLKTNEYHCSAKQLQKTKMVTDVDETFNYYLSSEKIVKNMIEIGEKYFIKN